MRKNKFFKTIRQITAGLLASAMVLTGAPLGGMTAWASVLPPNAALYPDNNTPAPPGSDYSDIDVVRADDTTTYGLAGGTVYTFGDGVWSSQSSADGLGHRTFNIGAITQSSKDAAKLADKGMSTSARSAFSVNYWSTFYGFGRVAEESNPPGFTLPVISPGGGYDPVTYKWTTGATQPTGILAYNSDNDKAANGNNISNNGQVRNVPLTTAYQTAIASRGANAGDHIEVRMEVKPTDDKQKLLITWTAYNPNNYKVDFWIGSAVDTQIAGTDTAPTIINEGQTHIHMMDYWNQGTASAWSQRGAFNPPSKPSWADYKGLTDFDVRLTEGKGRVWGGNYSQTSGVVHDHWVFSKNPADNLLIQMQDTSAGFSANLTMEAHEKKSTTFEVSMRDAVYYVDESYSGVSNGYIAQPFTDIQTALNAMKTAGVKKGYIYVASDVNVGSTIDVPDGLDVQIETSPYKTDLLRGKLSKDLYKLGGNPANSKYSGGGETIKRANATGAMFKVHGSGTNLSFYNINIDGANVVADSPVFDLSNGKLNIYDKTTITNAKTSGDAASVAKVSGGKLNLSAQDSSKTVSITGNTSEKASAIVIDDSAAAASHPVTINGKVNITGNKNGAGNAANVDVGKAYLWVEKGNTFTGKIGINTANTPEDDNHATPVVDFESRSSGGVQPYAKSNFDHDTEGQDTAEADISKYETGTSTNQQNGRIYLTAPFKSVTVSYVDSDGNSLGVNTVPSSNPAYDPNKLPQGTINPVVKQKGVGSKVGDNPDGTIPAPVMPGYIVSEVKFSPEYAESGKPHGTAPNIIYGTLTPGSGSDLGKIGGTIYSEDVDVTVKYIKAGKTYKFDTKGGNAIADKYEVIAASSTLGNLPKPVKTGYDFVKWVKYNDVNHNAVFDTGDTIISDFGTDSTPFPAPTGNPEIITLYAEWQPGNTLYEVRRNYSNSNPSLTLSLGSDADNYTITSVVNHDPAVIPCYKYVAGTRTPSSVGTLDTHAAPAPNAGHFHIDEMPALNVVVNYKYVKDPTQTKNFTVRHVDAGGIDIGSAPPVVAKMAEQQINAQKQNITGYTYDSMTIDAGWTSDLAHYIVGLDNPTLLTTNDSAHGVFAGYMPNQDVTVTFHYHADAGMNLVRKYLDHEMGDRLIHSKVDGPMAPGAAVTFPFGATDELYGYVYGSSNVEDLDPAHTATITVDASGNISGNMPASGNGVKVNFLLNHDPSKWRNINFAVANAPYEKGSINPLPAGAPTRFLANDTTAAGAAHAYSFNKLTAEGYIPTLNPNRYYKFDGWYLDAAATMPVNGTDTFPMAATPLTLYAKFVEDPAQWFDINFVAGANGSITAPNTLHIPYDYTWGQISSQLPTATPVINYNFNGWNDAAGNHMTAASTLVNHATYTAIFGKDPSKWGTDVGAISPYGRIGSDGSGEIEIRGTTPGNVYVISKPDGEIVAVVKGNPSGNVTTVPNLIPGAHYNVQEGTPDTVATVGQPTSSITGTSVSTPQDVFIPTVDSNYNIGYDPENEGMAQIVINPADPDADYALIDENGNVVNYPGSDNGWMTPQGSNPSTVTFNNLNPNETYTVVARKHGDTTLPDPLMKRPDGTQIVANPGDMAEVPKYVVETRNGTIVSVKDTTVNADAFNEAHAGETVTIHAEPVDANGKNFMYWRVLAGRAVGVSGNITQADYSFTLSNSNIVLKAVYEPVKIAGDDADVHEELRGTAGQGEFGLEPYQIPALANTLTTPEDRALQSVNGANVDYRVIFNKRDTTAAESNLVKPVSVSGNEHPDAYTAAYSLDIKLERYVDGRRVDAGIIATASNASVDVIAQLPAADVDQLDYQLFDVTSGAPVEITITSDVANNAGLVKFSGNLLHTYVMVYSKTFKVTFIDNKPVLDHLFLNDTSRNFYHKFKVRRKESVEDSYYSTDYDIVTAYAKNDEAHNLKTPFEDIYGVQYDYQNWSKKEDKLVVYDTAGPVTRRIVAYAYYSNNKPQVDKARVDLDKTIDEAKLLTTDPYLKLGEVAELNAAIAKAVETLRQARDLVSPDGTTYLRMANYEELQQAIDALRRLIDKYSKIARDRADDRNRRTGGASGGGNTSNGRGSKLLAPGEKSTQNTAINEGSNTRSFVLGVDGNWEKNPVTGGWSFVLNGGTPINDMWGMISFTDSTGKKVSRWYYFDGQSTMATGWVYDSKNGNWYFMNTNEGPDLGQMVTGWVRDSKTGKWYFMNENTGILVTGWHLDNRDKHWYYLNQNGEMLLGWQNINGKYYYFNTVVPQNTYEWDNNAFKWNYVNNNAKPFGAMYAGETTPDGYTVNANGEWN